MSGSFADPDIVHPITRIPIKMPFDEPDEAQQQPICQDHEEHDSESEAYLADEHRNDIAMIISAPYEFETFFPSDQLDTYIWLRVPNAHYAKMACTGICFPSSWLLPYNSAALRASGFAKFAQLLDDPQYQKRTFSRMMVRGVMPLSDPSKMKRFHLDLGPSDDSELHAEHLEALTLPRGIIRYSKMVDNGDESVPRSCAAGHDDACSCFDLKLVRDAAATLDAEKVGNAEGGGAVAPDAAAEDGQSNAPAAEPQGKVQSSRLPQNASIPRSIWDGELQYEYQIDDYCEIRHICNVIRLLMAIAGHRLVLTSAARVYSLAGLSKLFALSSSGDFYDGELPMIADQTAFANNFRSMISSWFYQPQNTKIMDILPEECFIIAWNIKLASVVRATFRIIVAETALLDTVETGAEPRSTQSRRVTAFGRELSGLLDDDMQNIVEHASSELIQRLLRLRDDTDAKISDMTKHVTPKHYATSYDFAKYPMFSQATQGVLATLVQMSDTLKTFMLAEQTLFNSLQLPFMFTVNRPIHNAFKSVQALLSHIAARLASTYRWASEDSKINHPSMNPLDTNRYISLYRREMAEKKKDWLLLAYKRLTDDQKCMTALYWKSLWLELGLAINLSTGELQYSTLLDAMAKMIEKAVIPSINNAMIGCNAEKQIRELQYDLLLRLRGLGLSPELEFGPGSTKEMFRHDRVFPAIAKAASEPFLYLHDRALFSPKIEMNALQRSPHLMLSLTASEFRFLPKWAGGDNDDTGAVFQDVLPSAQMGPSGPGPAYHTGYTTVSASSTAGADFSSSASICAMSAAGPPSVSTDGIGDFVDLGLSDMGTERAASVASGSTDSEAAWDRTTLDFYSRSSASQQAGRDISSVEGAHSVNTNSGQSLAAPSDAASSFVVVDDVAAAQTTLDVNMDDSIQVEDAYCYDVDDFEDDDDDDDDDDGFDFSDDDDDDNMQEIFEAMRQDGQL